MVDLLSPEAETAEPWFVSEHDLGQYLAVRNETDLLPRDFAVDGLTIGKILNEKRSKEIDRTTGLARLACMRFVDLTDQSVHVVPTTEALSGDYDLAQSAHFSHTKPTRASATVATKWADLQAELEEFKNKTPLDIADRVIGRTNHLANEAYFSKALIALFVGEGVAPDTTKSLRDAYKKTKPKK